jgi:hypothetical protein
MGKNVDDVSLLILFTIIQAEYSRHHHLHLETFLLLVLKEKTITISINCMNDTIISNKNHYKIYT